MEFELCIRYMKALLRGVPNPYYKSKEEWESEILSTIQRITKTN